MAWSHHYPVHTTSRGFLDKGLFPLMANKTLPGPAIRQPTSLVPFFPCPLFHVTLLSNGATHSDPCVPAVSGLSESWPFSLECLILCSSFKNLLFQTFPKLPQPFIHHLRHSLPRWTMLPEPFCAPLLPGPTLVCEALCCTFVLPMTLQDPEEPHPSCNPVPVVWSALYKWDSIVPTELKIVKHKEGSYDCK